METGLLLVICLSAAASAALLGSCVAETLQANRCRRRGLERGGVSITTQVLYGGVGFMLPLARKLLAFSCVNNWMTDCIAYLEEKGQRASKEGTCSLILCLILVLLVGSVVVSGTVVAGCAAIGLLCASLAVLARREREKRAEELREAIPDTLRSLSSCFQAGFSILQTFRYIENNSQSALRAYFGRAVYVLETGGGITTALRELRKAPSGEMSFVAVALEIQHEAGSSIKPVLDAASESISSELELRRSLRVQTAQAKLSARVVSLMPFALIVVFTLTTEDFLTPFFQSFAGIALLVLALVMQIAGIMLVRRMLTIGEV